MIVHNVNPAGVYIYSLEYLAEETRYTLATVKKCVAELVAVHAVEAVQTTWHGESAMVYRVVPDTVARAWCEENCEAWWLDQTARLYPEEVAFLARWSQEIGGRP